MAEEDFLGVEAQKGMDESFVFCEFPLGVASGWGLHGGWQGWKEPFAPAGPAAGLLGMGGRCASRAEGAGSTLHGGFVFPQTPSVFAVATVPFGQTIFAWMHARNDPSVPDS